MPDNKQLKERLRSRAEFLDPKRPTSLRFPEEAFLHREAADTIERLESAVDTLEREAEGKDECIEEQMRKREKLEAERERDAAVLGTLDARKLRALQLELPGEIWDDAIGPTYAALRAAKEGS